MADQLVLTWDDVEMRLALMCQTIHSRYFNSGNEPLELKVYAVPRGGNYVALGVATLFNRGDGDPPFVDCAIRITVVNTPEEADFIVDDLIDSGDTQRKYETDDRPFFALFDKRKFAEQPAPWIVFPWEVTEELHSWPAIDNITRIIQAIGDDPKREGLIDTPARVVRSWSELYAGYTTHLEDLITTFPIEDGQMDEMVLVKNIEFYSTCEHHMQPFFGRGHVAYIPGNKIIGVSKLARILDMYARRLQIQERICTQVTSAIDEVLQPIGSACVLEAKHFCMCGRGVNKQNSAMVTSSLTGAFRQKEVRAEFFSLIK
jgi:GTP cyclohydrolase IA